MFDPFCLCAVCKPDFAESAGAVSHHRGAIVRCPSASDGGEQAASAAEGAAAGRPACPVRAAGSVRETAVNDAGKVLSNLYRQLF